MSRVTRSLSVTDFHASYCMKMKAKGLKPKNKANYRKFVTTMGQVYADELLKSGIVQLPWGMGDLFLKNKKSASYKVGMVNELTPKVMFNDHTEGMGKVFSWISPDRKNKQINIWSFSAERTTKRELAKELKVKKHVYPDFNIILNVK